MIKFFKDHESGQFVIQVDETTGIAISRQEAEYVFVKIGQLLQDEDVSNEQCDPIQ